MYNIFTKIIVPFAVIAFMGLVFWKFYVQYKIKIRLKYYQAGNLIKIKDDRARILTDKQGKRKLKLFKLQRTTPVPELKFRSVLGRADYYEFRVDDNGELHPYMDVSKIEGVKKVPRADIITKGERVAKDKELYALLQKESKGKKSAEKKALKEIYKKKKADWLNELIETPDVKARLLPIPQERIAWMISENKILEDKIIRKGKFERLLPLIAPIIAYVTLFLLFYFGMKHLAGIAGSVGAGLEAIAKNCLGGG